MLSLLLILIFSMQSAHMAQAAVSPQPVANWNFDDCTACDSSGNNNNGTLDGQTRCVKGAWVSGHNTRAIRFASPARRVIVNDSSTFSALSQMTISMWLRNWGNGTLIEHGGLCPDGAPQFRALAFSVDLNPQSKIYVRALGGNGNFVDPMNEITSVTSVPTDGRWHHVAMTFDHGIIILYIDGKRDNATTIFNNSGATGRQPVPQTLFTQLAYSSDVLQIGSGYAYCIGATTGFYNPYGGLDTGEQTIVSKYQLEGGTPATYFLRVGADGTLTLFLRTASGQTQLLKGAKDVANGNFHHVAAVRDVPSLTLNIYSRWGPRCQHTLDICRFDFTSEYPIPDWQPIGCAICA